MKLKNALLTVTLVLLCASISTAASKMWVHVYVEDSTKEETIKINLPISVIETMLPIVEEKKLRNGRIQINEKEFRVEDLRKVWNDIRDEGNMEFVSVKGRDHNVRVFIQGNYLLIQPEEIAKKSKVDIKIPLKVVDAMLSGKGNELNLTAAVKALRDNGIQDIITVKDEDTSVRVWIDDKNLGK